MARVLIYGAAGYMGKLCARELIRDGLLPILAGRTATVRELAERLGCESVIFGLQDGHEIERQLTGVSLVINLAGPFAATQTPLIRACLATGAHYVDIAGEVDEMRSAFGFDEAARLANIMLMPGAGFGVVPTDIAANLAKNGLPGATKLTISYATEGGASRGTLKTVLKDINRPGVRRVGGVLVVAAPAESEADFEMAGKSFHAVYNPWRADLFTAGVSTGIPNIDTFSVFPGFVVAMMKGRLLWLRDVLLQHLLRFLPEGPSEKQLRSGKTYVKAVASNGSAQAAVTLVGPEAYVFTALCLREIARAILDGKWAAGFQTPAYYGKSLLDRVGASNGVKSVFNGTAGDRADQPYSEFRMSVVECDVPFRSMLSRELIERAYFRDSYRAPLSRRELGIVDVFYGIFGCRPLWMKLLLIVRNKVASLAGLDAPTASEIFHFEIKDSYSVGEKIGVWPIFALSEDEIVTGRNNKHLDFRLSVLKVPDGDRTSVVVSTICTVHNLSGKVYLFFIGPFHRYGVRKLMMNALAAQRL